MNPSVQAKSEGECPVPIALTCLPDSLANWMIYTEFPGQQQNAANVR